MLTFSGERIVPEADNCEPRFALKMYQEHIARYLFASQAVMGKSVVDVGCGVGYGAQLLAKQGAADVTAFDLSGEAIAHAREFYPHPKLSFLVAGAEDFSFDGRFDVVTAFEIIEHLQHQHKAIANIASTLKQDGLLIISTPRPTGERRPAYHARELSFHDFSNLLTCYFGHVEWFVENNHFASLITNEKPHSLEAIHAIHPQFGIGQADYFIAVASQSPVDRSQFQAQLVLNNDDYVRNLERDVTILHQVENDLQERNSALNEQAESAKAGEQTLRAQLTECASELERTHALRAELKMEMKADEARGAAKGQAEREALAASLTQAGIEIERVRTQKEQESRILLSELARFRSELTRLQEMAQQASRNDEELSSLRWRLSSTEQEVNRFRESALQAQAKINAIVESRSWRLTTPLRDFAMKVRGRSLTDVDGDNRPHSRLPEPSPSSEAPLERQDAQNGAHMEPDGKALYHGVLYVVGCNEGESKRYRVHNLAEGLTKLGYSIRAVSTSETGALLDRRFSARAIVFFRCDYFPGAAELLQYAKEHKIATIYDVDDLVFEPESIGLVRVVRTFSADDQAEYRRGVESYRRMMLACDRATCTTAYLAGRIAALGKAADVIPNSLNNSQLAAARLLEYRGKSETIGKRVGYFSGSNTHQVDFEVCKQALLSVMENRPQTKLVLVGILDLGPEWERLSHRVERHPIVPYREMLQLLATVDINLAPLELNNPYCESKSQLKIFEAGLVGVPTIASATASYQEAIDEGVDGFLATSFEDWQSTLEKLIDSAELRVRIGKEAKARALRQFGPQVVAERAEQVYGFFAPQEVVSGDRTDTGHPSLRITWVIPGLIVGSGGHRNILRAAYHLERFGHKLTLYFTDTELNSEQLQEAVRTHFYPLACPMFKYEGTIIPTDVLLATHWSTVNPVVRARSSARELMYFVQDFEPAFAPMGTEYILAENTYRLGLYCITSGPWCETLLRNEFGCEADHFVFPIDRMVYHPRSRTKFEPNVVFFAKPEMPRRCFDLGVMALEELHRLRPDVEIILFGSPHVEGRPLPFPATKRLLLPTIEDLATLYANADLGIAFSTTNPSLVPYEMMACGLPVVDLGRPGNEVNYGGREDIAFLADPDPKMLAVQVRDLLSSRDELIARSERGVEFVQTFPSEEEMARRVEDLILRRMTRSTRAMAMSA